VDGFHYTPSLNGGIIFANETQQISFFVGLGLKLPEMMPWIAGVTSFRLVAIIKPRDQVISVWVPWR
jgi:hypothetical protein